MTPEIQAYLEACQSVSDDPLDDTIHIEFEEAFCRLLPPRIRAYWASIGWRARVESGWGLHMAFADEYAYFPLLVDELGGNRDAAEVAWALGQRPAGYPIAGGA